MEHNKIIIFQDRKIRRIWHNDEWYYSVADIITVLTDTVNATDYIKKLRKRDDELAKGWGQIVTPLEIETTGGKQGLNCANIEGIFRIIQSIPSPKAEPFKRWLAKVGYERIHEIEDPELAQERMKELYEQKGYSKEWIVSKATFGKTVGEYKQFKKLGQENLRDHMTDLELIFSMLGEKVTTEITQNEEATGFFECKGAAKRGGRVAGKARVDAEKEIGKPIVSKDNYLIEPEKQRKLKKVN